MELSHLFSLLILSLSFPLAVAWHPPQCSHSKAESILLSTGSCCGALSYFLRSKVSYANATAYDTSLASYWALQEVQIHPACIVLPTSAEDVSMAVYLLVTGNRFYPGQCQFAVRSGGHTWWSGAANIGSGITIDMSPINEVTVSKDKSLVRIGPGNRWKDVYSVLDAQNLSTSGGRVGDVGVGGLILGGGISFFSPRFGWVCDNVANYEIVLPSGEIVNANDTSHSDLQVALRGGSNNFGIVTAFDMRLFSQGDMWGGVTVNPITQLADQFAAFEAFTGNPNYDPYAALIVSAVWIPASAFPGGWFFSNNFEYTAPITNPGYFANFTSFPAAVSTLRITNLTSLTLEAALGTPSGRRDLFATATFANSAKMMQAIFQIANATAQPLSHIPNITWAISFQPEPKIITHKSCTNSLGLCTAPKNLVNLLLSVYWDTPTDDALVYAQAKVLLDQVETTAKQLGVYDEYIYLNYAAPWQDPIGGYGAKNKKRLQEVSRKYDPHGVFQGQCPGGFKLFT